MSRFEHLTFAQLEARVDRLGVLRARDAASEFFAGRSRTVASIDKVLAALAAEMERRDKMYLVKTKDQWRVAIPNIRFGTFPTLEEGVAARNWVLANPGLFRPPPGYVRSVQGNQPYIYTDDDGLFMVTFGARANRGLYPTIEQAMIARDYFMPTSSILPPMAYIKKEGVQFSNAFSIRGRKPYHREIRSTYDTLEEAQASREFFLARPWLLRPAAPDYVPSSVRLPQHYIYLRDGMFWVKLGPNRTKGYFHTLENAIEVRDHFLSVENKMPFPEGVIECVYPNGNYFYVYTPSGTRATRKHQQYTTLREAIIARNTQVPEVDRHII